MFVVKRRHDLLHHLTSNSTATLFVCGSMAGGRSRRRAFQEVSRTYMLAWPRPRPPAPPPRLSAPRGPILQLYCANKLNSTVFRVDDGGRRSALMNRASFYFRAAAGPAVPDGQGDGIPEGDSLPWSPFHRLGPVALGLMMIIEFVRRRTARKRGVGIPGWDSARAPGSRPARPNSATARGPAQRRFIIDFFSRPG